MKNTLLLFAALLCWQACSQSSGNDSRTPGNMPTSELPDSSAILSDSPDHSFRLFTSASSNGDQNQRDLKVLRLKDLQSFLVATPPADAKHFWSADARFLVAENLTPDSTYKRELVLFGLDNLDFRDRSPGAILAFDAANEIVFYTTSDSNSQIISFYELKRPEIKKQRFISVAAGSKLPQIILNISERKARVKAYGPDDVPVNISFLY